MSSQQRQRTNGGSSTTTINRQNGTPSNKVMVKNGAVTRYVNRKPNNSLGTPRKNNSPMKVFQGTGRKLNNRLDNKTKREQLVNTYLTFTYEMRNQLPQRIFWRYVVLMLHSIDKIAGVSNNDDRYSQMFTQANKLNGTVSIETQNKWALKFEQIVNNAKRISPSTTKIINSNLKF